jgi:hypothetical protein
MCCDSTVCMCRPTFMYVYVYMCPHTTVCVKCMCICVLIVVYMGMCPHTTTVCVYICVLILPQAAACLYM